MRDRPKFKGNLKTCFVFALIHSHKISDCFPATRTNNEYSPFPLTHWEGNQSENREKHWNSCTRCSSVPTPMRWPFVFIWYTAQRRVFR